MNTEYIIMEPCQCVCFSGLIMTAHVEGIVKNANFVIDDEGRLEFRYGIWDTGFCGNGTFGNCTWKSGEATKCSFYGTNIDDCTATDCNFSKVVWNNGNATNCGFYDGEWKNGKFIDGDWCRSIWHDGVWKGGNWGKWLGGRWLRGIINEVEVFLPPTGEYNEYRWK